jgi:hypothetical protein
MPAAFVGLQVNAALGITAVEDLVDPVRKKRARRACRREAYGAPVRPAFQRRPELHTPVRRATADKANRGTATLLSASAIESSRSTERL